MNSFKFKKCASIKISNTLDKQANKFIGMQSENLTGLSTFRISSTTEAFHLAGNFEQVKM
jgi:hypothetical protein